MDSGFQKTTDTKFNTLACRLLQKKHDHRQRYKKEQHKIKQNYILHQPFPAHLFCLCLGSLGSRLSFIAAPHPAFEASSLGAPGNSVSNSRATEVTAGATGGDTTSLATADWNWVTSGFRVPRNTHREQTW